MLILRNIAAIRKKSSEQQQQQDVSTELKVSKKKKITKKLHLVETGPRLALTLFQVQENFCSGKNIYLRDLRKTKSDTGSDESQAQDSDENVDHGEDVNTHEPIDDDGHHTALSDDSSSAISDSSCSTGYSE